MLSLYNPMGAESGVLWCSDSHNEGVETVCLSQDTLGTYREGQNLKIFPLLMLSCAFIADYRTTPTLRHLTSTTY